jgi:hypothetical protein
MFWAVYLCLWFSCLRLRLAIASGGTCSALRHAPGFGFFLRSSPHPEQRCISRSSVVYYIYISAAGIRLYETQTHELDGLVRGTSGGFGDSCPSRVQAERDPYRSSPFVRSLAPQRARTPAYHKSSFLCPTCPLPVYCLRISVCVFGWNLFRPSARPRFRFLSEILTSPRTKMYIP